MGSMTTYVHQATHHRSAVIGIEACSIASNQAFPRHAHDQFGIGVIETGAQRSWSGRGPVEAEQGDTITVNPGEIHDGNPVHGQTRTWRMLYLDPDLLTRLRPDAVASNAEFACAALRDPVLASRFARLFKRLTAPIPDALAVEEDLVRTLAHVMRRHGSGPRPPNGSPPHVTRARSRVDDAPELPVTLAELAGLSGVSRFQLLRGFTRAVGITPHAYLLQQRVRLARRLLLRGYRPAEAAAEAGFADQSHLTRAFRRQFGTTPARYRTAIG